MEGFLFVVLIMFAFMYLILIRPQRQQQRRHTEMVSALKEGDEVITAGGIYGDVSEVQPDRVTLEIAEDVHIEVAKRAIASVVPPEQEALDELEASRAEAEAEVGMSQEDGARR
jgi:preprotein translocase subunit YajC